MKRRLAAWAVAVTAAAAIPSTSEASHGYAQLGRHTAISASETASLVVRASGPFSIRMSGDQMATRDIAFHGNGRVVSLVLRDAASPGSIVMSATRFRRCFSRACRGIDAGALVAFGGGARLVRTGDKVEGQVPAGVYQLVLLADGAPVSVEATFHGLKGSSSLRADHPETSKIETMKAVAPADGVGAIGSASRFKPPGTGVTTWLFLHLDESPPVAEQVDACFYTESLDVVLPGCLGGSSISSTNVHPGLSDGSLESWAQFGDTSTSTEASAGWSVQGVPVITRERANVAWLG